MPTSGDFWNPASWATLTKEVGVAGVFLFFLLVMLSLALGYILKRCLAKGGFVEQIVVSGREYAATMEANTVTQTEILRRHMENCDRIHVPGGPCNVEDLREAGHSFAEAVRKIGKESGADVDQHMDSVHKVLRSKPA